MTTYTTRSNANRAARQAAAAAGVAHPLAGVHFRLTEADGAFAYELIDVKTGQVTTDDGKPANQPHPAFTEATDEELAAQAARPVHDDPKPSLVEMASTIESGTADDKIRVGKKVEAHNASRQGEIDRAKVAKAAKKAKAAKPPKEPRGDSKRALVLGMLTRPGGVKIADIMAATAWLPHTTRAFISTIPRKVGLEVTARKDGADRWYEAKPKGEVQPTAE